jgi:hypothetical protein
MDLPLGGMAEAVPFHEARIEDSRDSYVGCGSTEIPSAGSGQALRWESLVSERLRRLQDDNLSGGFRFPPFRTERGKMGHPSFLAGAGFHGWGSWLHERGRSRLHWSGNQWRWTGVSALHGA